MDIKIWIQKVTGVLNVSYSLDRKPNYVDTSFLKTNVPYFRKVFED